MARRSRRFTPGYVLILAAAFLIAVVAGWTSLASRMDRDAYDWMSRAVPPPFHAPQSVVLAFDEESLTAGGGMRNIRASLAAVLEKLIPARPAAVAIDIVLSDPGDPAEDARLAGVFRRTPNLVLASDLVPGSGQWENPIPQLRAAARAVGHAHAAPDPVSRVLPLELIAGHDRRWAMALEIVRLKTGSEIVETPGLLQVGTLEIPASRDTSRALFIRYRDNVPVVSVAKLASGDSRFTGKAVFVGDTAQTAARDRLATPLDRMMSGVEIHAQAFETIVNGDFLRTAPLSLVVALCLAFTVLSGLVFAFLDGWHAYAAGGAVLLAAHVTPHLAFANGLILPYLATVWAAWLSAVAAAAWQYFVVRRQLLRSESDKQRYQQAIHWVTHEVRSPLTAIQGSSEMMGRYNLTDDKRKQMAQMINSESKRMATMIQTFLDIERLTDGQMEIRSEPFELEELFRACTERASVLAERKQITLKLEHLPSLTMRGDKELMEYAVYNLLTNAVKYSPPETTVTVGAVSDDSHVRLTVRDQGMGMDEKELRNIGRKFYRTKKAERSGEAGTGIGLSLVQQIVVHHNGRLEVTSSPGVGSCFTMVLPAISDARTEPRKVAIH